MRQLRPIAGWCVKYFSTIAREGGCVFRSSETTERGPLLPPCLLCEATFALGGFEATFDPALAEDLPRRAQAMPMPGGHEPHVWTQSQAIAHLEAMLAGDGD